MIKKKKIVSYLIQILVFFIIIWGVSKWQARNLLTEDSTAPDFTLRSLENREFILSNDKGKKVVLYFFSPWCSVCKYSSHNIVSLRQAKSSDEIVIYAVALSWGRIAEVEKFSADHKLNVPVLLGGADISEKYKIGAFPTIYIIDEKGRIKNRLVGYTTEAGLRLRL